MEPSPDTISSRRDKLNAQITGKIDDQKLALINRECLLDSLQALYDECSIENLQKYDKQIAQFVDKYKNTISEVKKLRVNITDFEIKDVIGRGHFGEVHVVKEKQTGDIYAMKTIRKCDSLEKTSFDIERDIMAFSNSSWITSLQYAFQDSIYLFFVMEYHPGGDLLGLLYRQGGTLPESAATFYLAEIALALEDLHLMGFVHRDIKPDNILLDRCGHLKLVDFGSAARLNSQGLVTSGVPVGTPDYIAPEVLQSVEKNSKKSYGTSCDYWSLGVLAYELTVGKTPFTGGNTSATYSRIMNHSNHLKFPPDVLLTQAYISFVRSLITDEKARLNGKTIKKHDLFKHLHFDTLRDQVPPYVPKITSLEDTSNFSDVAPKKTTPNVENFKKKMQFSGRNLPFIGFTFTHGFNYQRDFDRNTKAKDEIIKSMKVELENVKRALMKSEDFEEVRLNLEKKVMEKSHKLENIENIREKLERDLAASMAESTALKRTLEIERKDRAELERKALDLIKSAKIKWETSERTKVESLKLEIEQQYEKINHLETTNKMLNEQIKKAFSLENRHKESLEAVDKINRRSLVGLESKLEKVAIESRQKISNLESILNDTNEEKRLLEKKIEKMKNTEESLLKKLEKSNEEYMVLNGAASEAEKLVKELSEKVGVLEKDMERNDDLKTEIEILQNELASLKKENKDLDLRNSLLKEENRTIDEYKSQIENLKVLKIQNEKKINELESKLQEEETKYLSVQKQLVDSENLINESQQLKELRMKMWKMEKELSNAKIDKRIAERELKESLKEVKDLNEEIENLKNKIEENKKIHESSLLELNAINEKLSMELIKACDSVKIYEEKLESEKLRGNDDKMFVIQMKEMIREKDCVISEAGNKITKLKNESDMLRDEMKRIEKEKLKLKDELDLNRKENHKLIEEFKDAQTQIENHQRNLEALREACILIENQVIEYEKINTSIQTEKTQMAQNTEKLIADLCKAKEEIQLAKKQTNEEKSLKLLAETKIKRLNESLESLQAECDSYKDQFQKYRDCSNNLSEELTLAEEKVSDLEVTVKSYERQIEDFISENNLLKEEISQYLTQINALKESNFKLKQQSQELKTVKNLLSERIDDLESVLNAKVSYFEGRELKHESIIKQQTKLIDYLQIKIDEQSHKKKTLSDKLFGSSKKENQPPIILSANYKELELELQKQKRINKDLQEEIYKLKADLNCKATKLLRHKSEITSPQTKIAMDELTKSELFKQNSMQRMHHNIPHRFVQKICKKLTKCDYCTNQIMLGREISVCSECNMTVHSGCNEFVKSTCGLPQAYAKHFKDSLTRLNSGEKNDTSEEGATVEGWIKVLSKNNTWDKRYAVLTNTYMNIYMNSDKKSCDLLQSIDLKMANSRKKIVLEPVASEIGVNVASSDLPFIMKVEIATDCWPVISIVFMALSMTDRDKWYKAMQSIFDNESADKYHIESILTVPDYIYANCIIDISKNIRVLGTDQGLYSYHNELLLQIEGPQEVHQISIIPESNIVVMIASITSNLISCDLNHLINLTQCAPCTKPTLKYKTIDIKNLDGFHYLQASNFGKHQLFCAATSKQLVIVRYDLDSGDFIPLRIMDTAEPLGCALFTEHSLIVGADKFFEIDLSNFKAEEFLDCSDLRLKNAIKCHKIQSFPLAISQISENPKEFLISFNEFSVFVDEYGRCSRDTEIRTNYLPLDFYFIKPFLYIIQFSGVEILRLDNNKSVNVELKKMRFLGKNHLGIYVFYKEKVMFLEGRKILDCDDLSSICTEVESESDRFSFTSSVVQSLDGDTESVEEAPRRVKFESDL